MSEHRIAAIMVIGTTLISVSACSIQSSATPTPTIDLPPTNTPVNLFNIEPTDVYETLPGETVHTLPDGGEGEIAERLSIGIGNIGLTDTGQSVEKWQAGIWIANDLCHSVRGRAAYIGDIIEFAGYQIRVVDITGDAVVVAISGQLASPEEITEMCLSSIYNLLPDEENISIYLDGVREREFDSIELEVVGYPRVEEYTDVNGETVEGPAVELRIVDKKRSETWEGTVHIGDIIEFGGYRFRISVVGEVFVLLIWGQVD